MSASQSNDSTPNLHVQALWYACGEMDAVEAAAFERLLADDQQARDALIIAMSRLTEISEMGQTTPVQSLQPAPGYRESVRKRLQSTARTRAARPARAVAGGVLAAGLLIVCAWQAGWFTPRTPAPMVEEQPDAPDELAIESVEAIHFADLSSPDSVEDRVRAFHERQEQQKPRGVLIRNHMPQAENFWPPPKSGGPM